uniref:AlNc14C264G9873 protein n=1 Tax=Albugo laibachii Nc14 TaxID=890382 RepID=F0WU50_9STRA|nr:AlNc14C264G9873 [Albugo laibachii Nc14]|eukprot:CCA24895.1 AlNc14C264G9873 [Albugo laibachii Nc14]
MYISKKIQGRLLLEKSASLVARLVVLALHHYASTQLGDTINSSVDLGLRDKKTARTDVFEMDSIPISTIACIVVTNTELEQPLYFTSTVTSVLGSIITRINPSFSVKRRRVSMKRGAAF